MDGYTDEISKVKEFMDTLLLSGIEPAQVSYEAYKYALAQLEIYSTMENRECMATAAFIVEAAAKQAGIHSHQLMARSPRIRYSQRVY